MALHKTFNFLVFMELILSVTSDPCFDVFSVVQDNVYMTKHTYRKVSASSVYVCAAECLMSSNCLSFSYNKFRHVCHLNDNNTAVTDIVPSQDFIYSNISPWPKSLSGPCSMTTCSGNNRCQVDRLHRASCVQEFHGCSTPPKVTGSHVEYDGHFLDAVASYTCNPDFIECDSKTNSICQTSGEWENVTGLCWQYQWQNPVQDIPHYVPCGSSNGVRLTVIGTPTAEAGRFSLNSMNGDDTLFHMDFRINYPAGVENQTAINSRMNGIWGTHITLLVMPVAIGLESTMELTLQSGVYTVVVDGGTLTTFPERYAGLKAEYFVVRGHISVKHVKLTLLQ